MFSVKGGMSWLDEVPMKMPLGCLGEGKEEVELVTAPEITVPDYLKILQETEVGESLLHFNLLAKPVVLGVNG